VARTGAVVRADALTDFGLAFTDLGLFFDRFRLRGDGLERNRLEREAVPVAVGLQPVGVRFTERLRVARAHVADDDPLRRRKRDLQRVRIPVALAVIRVDGTATGQRADPLTKR